MIGGKYYRQYYDFFIWYISLQIVLLYFKIIGEHVSFASFAIEIKYKYIFRVKGIFDQ